VSRLGFYEVVRCESDDPEYAEIDGLEGYVAAKGDFDADGVAVFFYAIERVCEVPDSMLVSLGRIDEEELAHSAWARQRIAEENGATLVPPPSFERHIAGMTLLFQTIGESGAEVYRVGDRYFLKSEPVGPLAELPGEIERMRWLGDTGIPCPEIVETAEFEGRHWLLMSLLPGRDLTQSPDLNPAAACRIMAQALRTLHTLDASECPFDHRAERRIAAAKARLDAGLYDGADQANGPADYAVLFSTRPAHEDLVVTHGDACFPNVLARDGRFTGFVDCGRLGVADRYQDLALAARSLARNFGRAQLPAFFAAYGIDEPDEQKLAWYSLLDEFF
jgi:aminoglycoside 3'-phosphotransferase-2